MQQKGIKLELGIAQDAKKGISDIETTLKELTSFKGDAIAALNDLSGWRQSLIGQTSKAESTMIEFGRALEQLDIDPRTNKSYNQLFAAIQKSVAVAQKSMTRIDSAIEAVKQID